jgi:hypothetical protein
MARAKAAVDLDARPSAAEALWYDVTRWPAFVDGFGHVAKQEGDWPQRGARLVWDSTPDGRGRVVEQVVAYEVRRGQTVEVEDERITGTQKVTFTPREGGGSRLEVELDYRLKQAGFFTPLVDVLFVRRAFNDALRRTLSRFSRELAFEAELDAGAQV